MSGQKRVFIETSVICGIGYNLQFGGPGGYEPANQLLSTQGQYCELITTKHEVDNARNEFAKLDFERIQAGFLDHITVSHRSFGTHIYRNDPTIPAAIRQALYDAKKLHAKILLSCDIEPDPIMFQDLLGVKIMMPDDFINDFSGHGLSPEETKARRMLSMARTTKEYRQACVKIAKELGIHRNRIGHTKPPTK